MERIPQGGWTHGLKLIPRNTVQIQRQGQARDRLPWVGMVVLEGKGVFIPDDDGLPMFEEAQSDYQERVLKALDRVAERAEVPQADDIVVMRLPGGYTHMGVMVDSQNMLHVLLDRPSDLAPLKKYKHRIVAIYRPKRRRGSLLEFILTVYPPEGRQK